MQGWKLQYVSHEPRELLFPPVLRHPGLHPPKAARDSIITDPVRLTRLPSPSTVRPASLSYNFPPHPSDRLPAHEQAKSSVLSLGPSCPSLTLTLGALLPAARDQLH